jgi:hypothetical protein
MHTGNDFRSIEEGYSRHGSETGGEGGGRESLGRKPRMSYTRFHPGSIRNSHSSSKRGSVLITRYTPSGPQTMKRKEDVSMAESVQIAKEIRNLKVLLQQSPAPDSKSSSKKNAPYFRRKYM